MNKTDRKAVSALLEQLQDLRSKCEAIGEQITELAEAEREKFDNMPEGLQEGERGQKIDEAATLLEEAACAAQDSDLTNAIDSLELIEL